MSSPFYIAPHNYNSYYGLFSVFAGGGKTTKLRGVPYGRNIFVEVPKNMIGRTVLIEKNESLIDLFCLLLHVLTVFPPGYVSWNWYLVSTWTHNLSSSGFHLGHYPRCTVVHSRAHSIDVDTTTASCLTVSSFDRLWW